MNAAALAHKIREFQTRAIHANTAPDQERTLAAELKESLFEHQLLILVALEEKYDANYVPVPTADMLPLVRKRRALYDERAL